MDEVTRNKVLDAALAAMPQDATAVEVAARFKRALADAARIAAERARIMATECILMERQAAEREDRIVHPRMRMRADCPHAATMRHGDPTGGSDGFTECLICGDQF